MSWTKRQFVDQAFEEIGYASYTFDLEPEQLQAAMRRLDSMMATWNGRGIRVGYPLPATPGAGDLDDLTDVPDYANEAIYLNLAIRIAPTVGKAVSRETKVAAKFYSLFERYNGPIVSASDIFRQVAQANPANFPKVFEADEASANFNHTLFGNKGNGGFPNPYAESVRGFKDRFSNTTLAQFQINQDLGFIPDGLKLRALASVRTYTENQNEIEHILDFVYSEKKQYKSL
mgnify:CR=1 FL=1